MKNGCFSRGCFWPWLRGRWASHCLPRELFRKPRKFSQPPWVSCLSIVFVGFLRQEAWRAGVHGSQSQTQLSGWAAVALGGGSPVGLQIQVFAGLISQTLVLKVEVPERAVLCSLGRSSRFEFPAGWELLCLGWGLWPECVSAFPGCFGAISLSLPDEKGLPPGRFCPREIVLYTVVECVHGRRWIQDLRCCLEPEPCVFSNNAEQDYYLLT